jgi:hypothetical protein
MSSRGIRPVLTTARAPKPTSATAISVGTPPARSTSQRPHTPLLAEHDITTQRARDAVWLVVGSGGGDGPRFDPATLLATLGIDLDQIRRHVEMQFGPDAIHRLYASEVGWHLRPRGPLCDLALSPQLKRAVDHALGHCWDTAPPQMHEHLLLSALDSDSSAVAAVFDELGVSVSPLRGAVTARLQIAS